jgi:heme-degrading monooxygenase HmoA
MFIAMNRFRVAKGSEAAFEHVWLSRDSYLDKVPGFVEFHLLKGPEAEDHTLYASHTVWVNRAAFEAWTQSEAFRAAHHRAGDNKPLYLGHPQFEGLEVRQQSASARPRWRSGLTQPAFGATEMVGGDGLHQAFGFKGFLESGAISR